MDAEELTSSEQRFFGLIFDAVCLASVSGSLMLRYHRLRQGYLFASPVAGSGGPHRIHPRHCVEFVADLLSLVGSFLTLTLRQSFVLFSLACCIVNVLLACLESPPAQWYIVASFTAFVSTLLVLHVVHTAVMIGLLCSWLSVIIYLSLLFHDVFWPVNNTHAIFSLLVREKVLSIVALTAYLHNLTVEAEYQRVHLTPRWYLGILASLLGEVVTLLQQTKMRSMTKKPSRDELFVLADAL